MSGPEALVGACLGIAAVLADHDRGQVPQWNGLVGWRLIFLNRSYSMNENISNTMQCSKKHFWGIRGTFRSLRGTAVGRWGWSG